MAVKAKSSKKPQSEKRKGTRARSWESSEERKRARQRAQDARYRTNQARRCIGEPTLAEVAYLERRERRETLAVIRRNPCDKPSCQRFNGHKGKHGPPTQTELNDARSMAAWLRVDRSGKSNYTPRAMTWERAQRRLLRGRVIERGEYGR